VNFSATVEGNMKRLLTPNKITALRVLLGCAAVGLYAMGERIGAPRVGAIALALTILCIALDGLDGYLARRLNLATPVGAQFDIVGDRVIENVFFTYFAVCGQISLWVPVIFFVRGSMTDFLRGLAAMRESRFGGSSENFRRNWLLSHNWSRRIVASRASRTAYAGLKCVCFCALGYQWMLLRSQGSHEAGHVAAVAYTVGAAVFAAIAFCLLRAIPVVWEGRRDFLELGRPTTQDVPHTSSRILRIPVRRAAATR
jgi:CDP-diacylglycerol--glycerol-3-phosphate 3-phosphatidyltransferase